MPIIVYRVSIELVIPDICHRESILVLFQMDLRQPPMGRPEVDSRDAHVFTHICFEHDGVIVVTILSAIEKGHRSLLHICQ